MSKSSRDLSKGIAVKSNGFKYGGGKDEGWGTGKAKGRRLGKGQGERDVAARARLKARLLARTEREGRGRAQPRHEAKLGPRRRVGERRVGLPPKRAFWRRTSVRRLSNAPSPIDRDERREYGEPRIHVRRTRRRACGRRRRRARGGRREFGSRARRGREVRHERQLRRTQTRRNKGGGAEGEQKAILEAMRARAARAARRTTFARERASASRSLDGIVATRGSRIGCVVQYMAGVVVPCGCA